jgi:hypothetical protein
VKPSLAARFEVAYYDADGRRIYWPADNRSEILAEKLRECREVGHADARLCEVSGRA